MWKSEIFLKKIYRASSGISNLLKAAAYLADDSDGDNESLMEEKPLHSLAVMKENICVYFKVFYDDRMEETNNSLELDGALEQEFTSSLTHDSIDPNNLQGSYGIFIYKPHSSPSVETQVSSSALTGGSAVGGGPSTPPRRTTYKFTETPAKMSLVFLTEQVGSPVSGHVHIAYVLISPNYDEVYILIYYSLYIEDIQRNNPNTISKISQATNISEETLMDTSVHAAVHCNNIRYDELLDLIAVNEGDD